MRKEDTTLYLLTETEIIGLECGEHMESVTRRNHRTELPRKTLLDTFDRSQPKHPNTTASTNGVVLDSSLALLNTKM